MTIDERYAMYHDMAELTKAYEAAVKQAPSMEILEAHEKAFKKHSIRIAHEQQKLLEDELTKSVPFKEVGGQEENTDLEAILSEEVGDSETEWQNIFYIQENKTKF